MRLVGVAAESRSKRSGQSTLLQQSPAARNEIESVTLEQTIVAMVKQLTLLRVTQYLETFERSVHFSPYSTAGA